MLLSFSIKNWRVYKNEVTFSLYASKERGGSEHNYVLTPAYRKAKVLPLAAMYGANASGKTSFFEALGFLQFMVVDGMSINQMIPVEPFKLDADSVYAPCEFSIEFLSENTIYRYQVGLTRMQVCYEELCSKNSRNWETLYRRDLDNYEFFGKYNTEQNQLIKTSTRSNQLYLHNAIALNASEFLPAFNWFANNLQLLGVNAQFNTYSAIFMRNDFKEFINEKLRKYNTGITGIDLQPIALESIPIPDESLREIIASAPQNGEDTITQIRVGNAAHGSDIYILNSSKDGEIEANKIMLQHQSSTGELINFELTSESRGTQRLLEFLPVFFEMASVDIESGQSKVFVIDELDQSFHSALLCDLIKDYLASCSQDSRHQLVFTLHDLMLMDKDFMRKDEMWFCAKPKENEAELVCLGKIPGVRTDTDILKNYVNYAFGGYPKF